MYPPDVKVIALENGWATEQNVTMYGNDLLRYEYIYTPEGVLNISNRYVNGSLYSTYRLNDFDYEFEMVLVNRKLDPSFESVFLMPTSQYMYLSSSIVKEVVSFGGDAGPFVPPLVEQRLRKKLGIDSNAKGAD